MEVLERLLELSAADESKAVEIAAKLLELYKDQKKYYEAARLLQSTHRIVFASPSPGAAASATTTRMFRRRFEQP